MPFCSSCGTEVPTEGGFCPSCGHQLVPDQTPAPGTPSATGPNFLGPMTIGGIVSETLRILKQYFLKIWAIVLAIVSFAFMQGVLSTPTAELQRIGDNIGTSEAALEQTRDDLINFVEQHLIVYVIGFLVMLAITSLISLARYGALVHAISQQYVYQRMDIGRAYQFALRRLAVLLGATAIAEMALFGIEIVVIGVTVAAAFLFPPLAILGFLAAIVIPIYLLIRWSLIWPVVLLEGEGPVRSLSRSTELVRGNWWRVFGIMVVFFIMLALMSLILSFSIGKVPIAGPFVVNILLAPILSVLHLQLYLEVAPEI